VNGMDVIERYVKVLKKKLPAEKREGAEKEVRGLIEEKMAEKFGERAPSGKEVEDVLREMGDPRILAAKYHPQKRHLIGPDFFDTYIMVLKIVVAVVFFGLTLALGVSFIFNPPINFWAGVGDYFSSILSGVIQAGAWVTIFFVLFERLGGEKPDLGKEKTWDPSQLPGDNGKEGYIKPSEPILGIIFIILAMVFFNAAGRGGDIFSFGEETPVTLIPFLNQEVFGQFLPVFNVFFVLAIVKEGYKLFTRRWTLLLAGLNGFLNVSFMILFIYVFTRPGILDDELLLFFTRETDLSGEILDIVTRAAPRFFLGIFSLGLIIDTVTSFLKVFKSGKLQGYQYRRR